MSDLRNQLINRIDVLNKVKKLFLIPKLEMMPTKMVAEFYGVEQNVIRQCYIRNKKEIVSDGIKVMGGSHIRSLLLNVTEVKQINAQHMSIAINGRDPVILSTSNNTYFSPRAVLRIGMLLRDSEVAKEVRTQLLNTFETCSMFYENNASYSPQNVSFN